jgi:hypothetical protein
MMDTGIATLLAALVAAFAVIVVALIKILSKTGGKAAAMALAVAGLLVIILSFVFLLPKLVSPLPTDPTVSPTPIVAQVPPVDTPTLASPPQAAPAQPTDTQPPVPQPTDTQPPPAPMTPTLLPVQTLSSGQTGIPIPDGTTMPAGSSVIVREVYFDKKEAKVWWTPATTEPITFGAGVLGAPGWNRDGWYATTAWPRQALEACQEAQRIVNGSLGGSGWKVTLQNSNVPATCP